MQQLGFTFDAVDPGLILDGDQWGSKLGDVEDCQESASDGPGIGMRSMELLSLTEDEGSHRPIRS